MNNYLDLLAKIAEAVEPVSNVRMAACLVYKGRVVSVGVNKYKTDPFQKTFASDEFKIHTHAEVSAIKIGRKYLNASQLQKAVLYVARIKRPSRGSEEWMFGMAKPCSGCRKCIDHFGIKKVVYSQG